MKGNDIEALLILDILLLLLSIVLYKFSFDAKNNENEINAPKNSCPIILYLAISPFVYPFFILRNRL